ncbi:hypothetical protein RRG08_043836, partial [Elysia crispata]
NFNISRLFSRLDWLTWLALRIYKHLCGYCNGGYSFAFI